MPTTFDLLVFDWDGTVVDSAAHIVTSLRSACQDIGLPAPEERRARYIIGLGLQDAMNYLLPQLPASDYSFLVERYRYHFLAGQQAVSTFSGIPEGISDLRSRGFLLAVATGKSRRGLDHALADTGLGQYFHISRCADEGFSKPHPDMLLTVMESLNVSKERTLMIGDTTHDLEMARNAGVSAVAVSYGAHEKDALHALDPLACVDSSEELMKWLQENA